MVSGTLRDTFRAFTTTCALLTTDGPDGPNVMAAEWTFQVSYQPFLILVSIDPGNRTHDMILAAKEFGVNLVAEPQIAAMAFAGHYSKADTDKLASDAFATFPAKRIRAPMIRDALLNAECRLVAHYPMGDHTAFLGEVVEFSVDPEKPPIVLHRGSHQLGARIVRAPGIVAAVTPMRARAGTSVSVTGEFTVQDRGGRAVEAAIRDRDGQAVVRGTGAADAEGTFQIRLDLPPGLPPGRYEVAARCDALEGLAHLDVAA